MGIPNKVSPLTGELDILPKGYLPAEFLESTGTQYVDTDILWKSRDVIRLDYETITDTTNYNIFGFDFSYRFINTERVQMVIASSPITFSTSLTKGKHYILFDTTYRFEFDGEKLSGYLATWTAGNLTLFSVSNHTYNAVIRVYKFTHKNEAKVVVLVPAVSPLGEPCLVDIRSKKVYKNTGSGAFIVGMTPLQARNLSKLPVVESGTLTVSLPWDAQWDIGVQNALSIASAKGWTITVQYRDPEPIAAYLPISFLEITGYGRTTTVPYPYPHFDIPLPAVTDTDEWEFSTVHAVNFSTGIAQAEGWNGTPALFYGATTAKKFYAGSSSGVATTSTYDVDAKPHTFSFQQKGTQSYASFDGQELKLRENSTSYPSSIGVFVALKPNWENYYNYPFNGKKYSWQLSVNGVNVHNLIPALDSSGIPCMLDLVTNQPFRNAGTGSFIAGFDTVEQSRKLATLPDVTAETDTTKTSLTVSLPWEAQWDEVVQSALQVAADKGWTLTVQYRDPEVATKNIPIGFLESTGTQYIDTLYAPNNESGMLVSYKAAVRQDYMVIGVQDVIDGTTCTIYPIRYDATGYNVACWGAQGFYGQGTETRAYHHWMSTLNWGNNRLTTIISLNDGHYVQGKLSTLGMPAGTGVIPQYNRSLWFFGRNNQGNFAFQFIGRIYFVKISQGFDIVRNWLPVLTPSGTPCMFERFTKQPFYNSGTGAFIAGFDTPEQARNLAYLPDVTAETDTTKTSLTVSLPWETQWDVIVQAALQVAADRGWTITVQYRDPEVTTTNIPISFLESTGTQYMDTGIVPNNESGILLKSYLTSNDDTIPCGSRNLATTDTRFYAVRSHRKYAYEEAYMNGYGWGAWINFQKTFETYIETTYLNWMNDRYAKCKAGEQSLSTLSFEPEYPLYLFAANIAGVASLRFKGRIWNVAFSQSSEIVRSFFPALDLQGIPCMYDKVSETRFYNDGTGAFIAGFDTIEQARSLAYLPDVTAETDAAKKSLTVSLPWEAQLVITYVPAALQVAADRGWTITVQYRDPEADNAYYNKYAACTTRADMEAVNPDYINDLTGDDEWIYPLPNLKSFSLSYQEKIWANGKLKKWQVPLPKLTSVPSWWFNCKTLEYMDLYAPEALTLIDPMRWCSNVSYCKVYAPKTTRIANLVTYNSKLKEIEIDAPNVTNAQGTFFRLYSLERIICASDIFHKVTNGIDMYLDNSKLLDFPTSYPALSTASGMFGTCQITGQQAIEILTSIPTWTDGASHPITLGIHIDYENDPDVLAAIALADIAQTPTAEGGKGWTVTVQWNGTATTQTASTFGLRRKPVYAKLRTIELPDGATENVLDWGHYVTNWEENGYQEFSSIEEAEEHFNINQTEEV